MKTYRSLSDLPASRRTKAIFGQIIKRLRPRLAEQVSRNPFNPAWDWSGKLVRNALLTEAVERGDHEALRRFFTDYWSSTISEEFYDGYADRFENLFLRHHAVIVERIEELLPSLGEGNVRLVEVGSGDGKLLEWLSQRLDGITEFHGVDLNEQEISKCRETHHGSEKLFFHHGDLLDWLRENPAPRTILMANGGVLEYLLRDELAAVFAEFHSLCSPCIVAVTESIGTDHDLGQEPQSFPYGLEFAFSHNYPAILREADFEIRWERNRPTEPGEENYPVRWYQLVASGGRATSQKAPMEKLPMYFLTAAQFAVF